MSDPLNVPRPHGAGPPDLVERVRALRGDARVGAAVLACVAIAVIHAFQIAFVPLPLGARSLGASHSPLPPPDGAET